jgi:diadenosine tetraphosphate (Ap4A) HIT family hydrolase
MEDACYSCRRTALSERPPREWIVERQGWRVAHAINCALPGWLVVLPLRHVEALSELTVEETAAIGPLLVDASRALERVTACAKTYVMLLAEAEGFHHLHFHVVPRMDGWPHELRGAGVFDFLRRDPSQQLSDQAMDALALRLRAAFDAG